MPKLSADTPLIHPTAEVVTSTLGRYTEVEARTRQSETVLGDYSYVMQDCAVWATTIGKFANIASAVRINAANHPIWRPAQHHFTYRAADYFDGASNEDAVFAWRRAHAVRVSHDVWIGHGATLLPGVIVGDGAVSARPIRERFSHAVAARFQRLAGWNWPREALFEALQDFWRLDAEAFLDRFESGLAREPA